MKMVGQLKPIGAERADQVFDKKEDAIERAKEIAENKESKVRVQDEDGKNKTRFHSNKYGHLPSG